MSSPAEVFDTSTRAPGVFTVAEVAARLGVSRRTVSRMIAEGKLRACTHMGRDSKRVTQKQLDDFLEGDQ